MRFWQRTGAVIAGISLVGGIAAHGALAQAQQPFPRLVLAGDVACGPEDVPTPTTCQQAGTAALVESLNPTAVQVVGDEQYEHGFLSEYEAYYAKTWGLFKEFAFGPQVHLTIGNHEYNNNEVPGATANGFFDYFDGVGANNGPAGPRGKGYYSYNLGHWHVVSLNANCAIVSCAPGSAQQQWLTRDLQAHPNQCILAAWHQPLFTNGLTAGDPNGLATRALWQTLYKYGADVIVNGHDHNYQRYAPQTPAGQLDVNYGIREFVVGTGGKSLFPLHAMLPNEQVSNQDTYGVLVMTLRPHGYSWKFVPMPGANNGTFTDHGSASCHGRPPHSH